MRTGFLYVQPSLLRGMASVMDLWGQLNEYNTSVTAAEADLIALRTDWEMIGQDLRNGMREFTHNPQQMGLFTP